MVGIVVTISPIAFRFAVMPILMYEKDNELILSIPACTEWMFYQMRRYQSLNSDTLVVSKDKFAESYQ